MEDEYLSTTRAQFEYYKSLGDKTFAQLDEAQLFWQSDSEANSIAIIVNHLHGNMLSRWTDFLHSDGEKNWRRRDAEFENSISSKESLLEKWEDGWTCLFEALNGINEANFNTVIYIRNQGHSIVAAVNRQLAHYAYHVGQIVFIGRQLKGTAWQSLSIAKGKSAVYNTKKFAEPKRKEHFTKEFLKKKS